MYEGKSEEEYNMMLQVARIMKLSSANFNALCEKLDISELHEIENVLEEAKEEYKTHLKNDKSVLHAVLQRYIKCHVFI